MFTPNICYTASIQGLTNGTHEEEKDVMEERASEDNAVRFSWICPKQMDVSFNCMLQFLDHGAKKTSLFRLNWGLI